MTDFKHEEQPFEKLSRFEEPLGSSEVMRRLEAEEKQMRKKKLQKQSEKEG